MKPVFRLAGTALLWLCCGAQALAAVITNLASGSYTCATGAHQGNINELNMNSANGQANYIEVKVLDGGLPSSTKLCYTTKNTGHSFDSICQPLGSAGIKVYRAGSLVGTGDKTAFAVGDYLVLEVPGGAPEVNEAMLLTSANLVIDYIQLCTGSCSTGYWSTSSTSCGAQLPGVGKSVKDIARFPEDGTGTWSSNTLNSGIPAKGTLGASNSGVSGLHHFELRASGSALSCAASTLTIKACGNAACDIAYTDGASGTLSAVGGNIIWDEATGGADGADFVIEDNTSSVTKNFQALGTATLGIAGLPTTCNFGGSTACQFTALSGGFIVANSNTSTTDLTIPTQTAGAQSASYYLRALQASTNNPAVCTPAIVSQTNVPVTVGYACDDPSSCQNGNLLKVLTDGDPAHATAVPAAGGSVNFVFDATGSASFGLLYEDAGRITVTASKNFTPFTGAATVAFSTAKQFAVKPHHFGLSAINCSDGTLNPGATTATDAKFCKAGANFSVTATALTATGATAKNYGRESSPESIKLTGALLGGLGLTGGVHGLPPTLDLNGTFDAVAAGTGAATGTAFSWNEVGIITLTPKVGDGSYLDAGDVADSAVNVGRFIPDHFDTIVVQPSNFTYSGQPFISATVTAKSVSGTTTTNYNTNFARAVDLSAPASPAPVAPAVEPGALSANAPALLQLKAADFLAPTAAGVLPASSPGSAILTGTLLYTFTKKETAPTTVKLHAQEDGATGDGVSSSTGAEGSALIRSGRLRLSNAFGRANTNLEIPMRAEYWTGQSWLLNSDDGFSLIPAGAVALTLNGVTGVSVVVPAPEAALAAGQGKIVLKKPASGTGSVDLAVNLGSTLRDQSCLGAHPDTLLGAALPWLRSQNGRCATTFDRDPSARGTFGVYSPESKKVIHIRESFN